MASEDKSSPSSNQMEKISKQLRRRGYKLIVEYDDDDYTGQPSKISGEIPPRKTLWDYLQLLIIPLVLLGFGSWFSYQQSQTSLQIAEDQQKESILVNYEKDISDLLLNYKLSSSQKKDDAVRIVARAKSLDALRSLDGDRKGLLVQFLSEAELMIISGPFGVIIDISGADLRGVNLRLANLRLDEMAYTDMTKGNLSGANLSDAILAQANLSEADLSDANLFETNLYGANLSGANLSGAHYLTQQQLDQVLSCKDAILPPGLTCHRAP